MGTIVELWPEQSAALEGLRTSVRAGKRRPVLELPTGSGKTVIASKIVDGAVSKGNRVAFTVPLMSLIDQSYERFVSYGLDPFDIGVIQADHPLSLPQAPVQICSVQTLQARNIFPDANVVVVDEAHLQHRIIYKWMAARPGAIFVALSATPWARGMGDWYDDLIKPASMKQLMKAQRLCQLCAYGPHLDLSDVKIVSGDYHEEQLSHKMRKREIVADVVQTWCLRAEGRPTLVFAVDRKHAAVLTERFQAVGVAAVYVDADTDRDERHRIVDAFHRGEIKMIISIGTMNAGIDLDVRCVEFACPSKSEIKFVQSVGRGMRWKVGKDYLLLLDHSNCSREMGLPQDIRFERLLPGRARNNVERALGERSVKKPLECPKCHRLAENGEKACAGCGHKFTVSTDVRELDGDLRRISFEGAAQEPERRQAVWDRRAKVLFFGELKTIQQAKGYKAGWCWMKYKDRFGELELSSDTRLRYLMKTVEPQPISLGTAAWLRSQQIRWAMRNKKLEREAADGPTAETEGRHGGDLAIGQGRS